MAKIFSNFAYLQRNVDNLKMQKEALELGAITRFGNGKHQSKFTKKIK